MASSNNLDALFADGGLPFGHPGRRFDDTPEYFDRLPGINRLDPMLIGEWGDSIQPPGEF